MLGVFADRPLHRPQLAIAYAARTLGAHLLVLIPVGEEATGGLPAEALVRSVFAARDRMPPATLVAVPLARRRDEISDALLRARVAAAYGVTHLLSDGTDMFRAGRGCWSPASWPTTTGTGSGAAGRTSRRATGGWR